jgi:CDP-paratose synthetase
MNILLTGATGFLGSHILKGFLKNNYDVTILKRSFSDTWRITDCLDKVRSFDINKVSLEKIFSKSKQFDCIVHTATDYGRESNSPLEVFKSNLDFPLSLLNIASSYNVPCFFNTSTFLINASKEHDYLNCYSLSKEEFEKWGRIFTKRSEIQFINIKLEHMYGALDSSSKFVDSVIRQCQKNVDKIDLTLGKQKRDFVYIDDVVNAYKLLIKKRKKLGKGFQEIYLGNGKGVSIEKFVRTCAMLTKSKSKLMFGALPYRKHEMMSSKANISRLKKLGWKPKYNFITGLKKMLKENKQRV